MRSTRLSAEEEERYDELAEQIENGDLVVAGRRRYGKEATFPTADADREESVEEQ